MGRNSFKDKIENLETEIIILSNFLKDEKETLSINDLSQGLKIKKITIYKKIEGLVESHILIIKMKIPLSLEINPKLRTEIKNIVNSMKSLLNKSRVIIAKENLIKRNNLNNLTNHLQKDKSTVNFFFVSLIIYNSKVYKVFILIKYNLLGGLKKEGQGITQTPLIIK